MHRSGIKESSYAIRAYPLFQTLFYLNFKPFLLDSFLLSVWHEASRELTVGLIKKTKAAETNLTFTDGFNERTRPHISSYQLQLNTTVDYNICQCKWKIKTTPPFWMMKKWRVLVLALVHGWYWERGGFNSYFSSIKIVASHPGWRGGGDISVVFNNPSCFMSWFSSNQTIVSLHDAFLQRASKMLP